MGDDDFMRLALALAERGDRTPGGSGIGCVIVREGAVLADAYNEVSLRHDPTAHAEIVAIRRACERLGADDLRGAALYSTLQPCGMCAMATIWAKLSRVVYGAENTDVHPMYFEDRHTDTMRFIRDAFRTDITYTGSVLATDCARLYVGPHDAMPESEQANR